MRPKHWLFFGTAAICASHLSACSSKFDACSESRTCTAGGASEAGAAGAAGAAENSGGDSGAAGEPTSAAGALGQPEAGASGEAGATQIACDATHSACGEACVDLKADGKNCGKCGHDCLGGECLAGQCEPTTVAPQQDQPIAIATDGSYVYWLGAHDAFEKEIYVARRRADGSGEIKTIAPSETHASALAVAGNTVYWLSADHVRACDAPDCLAGPHDFQPSVSNRCLDLLFEPSNSTLYWSCNSNYQQNDGSLWSVPVPGATPIPVEPNSGNPEQMTTDGENLYWTNSSGFGSDNKLTSDGAIWRLQLKDGSRTRLVSGLTVEFGSIAVGGDTLYAAAGDIVSVPLPYGAATTTKVADGPVDDMVADAQALYWSDATTGLIKRCLHSGCVKPDVIATGQNSPQAMAEDAVSIYWLSGLSLTTSSEAFPVQRLAK